jgi:NTE family protein
VPGRADHPSRPRIGLVLGAGGVLGGAWLTGALHALASETGWDPGSAGYIVGTSAGSMVGALLACGVPPWLMLDRSAGRNLDEVDARSPTSERSAGDRAPGSTYRLERGGLPLGPGSWRLALSSLAHPSRYPPAAVVSGWLPRGMVSTEPLKATVRRACGGEWAPHPQLWAIAVDYATGRRVAFGRRGSPAAALPDAVAASCAIPGFYRAVEIGGRTYVDGGVRSLSNLDVLRDEPLDLVLALSPMSSLYAGAAHTMTERLAARMRQAAGRRLGAEARRLREAGLEVVLVQPTEEDLDAMGSNPMSSRRRPDVVRTAVRTVTEQLQASALRDRLSVLPPGDPLLVRAPEGTSPRWAELRAAAENRWAGAQAG